MLGFKRKEQSSESKKKKLDKSKKDEIEERVTKEIEEKEPELKKESKLFKRKVKDEVNKRLLIHNETLSRVAPSGNIKFRDIDFVTKGKFCTILTFSVKKGSFDGLSPLWGMKLIPKIENTEDFKNKNVTAKTIYSITRRKDDWAEKKADTASSISKSGYSESNNADQSVSKNYFKEYYFDTETVSKELSRGASYLDLSIRIVVTAASREDLYYAIFHLENYYSGKFEHQVELVPFAGEMKTEYSNLMDSARNQRGENYNLTSKELAGSYPFISSGVNDENGTYIGRLHAELNSDPVLLDTTNINKLGVICAKNRAMDIGSRVRKERYDFMATTAWSNKITQDAFANGNRVVEYVLNGEHVERMREGLLGETAYIDLTNEDNAINMFEPFVNGQDNQSALNVTMNKVQEIARQYSKQENINDTSTLNSGDMIQIENELKEFYDKENMWKLDPEEADEIRFVGLNHDQYPILSRFNYWIKRRIEKEREKEAISGTTEQQKSLSRIKAVFDKIHSRNENLFNRHTSINESYLEGKMKIIFDFKMLKEIHHAALMGHFVNSLAYGEQMLEEDDVLIIHGADELTESVKRHLRNRIGSLNNRGIKVFLLYNDADILFEKRDTEDPSKDNVHRTWFQNADLRISNSMQAHNIQEYEGVIKNQLPKSVKSNMVNNYDHIYYMNRDTTSALFRLEITD